MAFLDKQKLASHGFCGALTFGTHPSVYLVQIRPEQSPDYCLRCCQKYCHFGGWLGGDGILEQGLPSKPVFIYSSQRFPSFLWSKSTFQGSAWGVHPVLAPQKDRRNIREGCLHHTVRMSGWTCQNLGSDNPRCTSLRKAETL